MSKESRSSRSKPNLVPEVPDPTRINKPARKKRSSKMSTPPASPSKGAAAATAAAGTQGVSTTGTPPIVPTTAQQTITQSTLSFVDAAGVQQTVPVPAAMLANLQAVLAGAATVSPIVAVATATPAPPSATTQVTVQTTLPSGTQLTGAATTSPSITTLTVNQLSSMLSGVLQASITTAPIQPSVQQVSVTQRPTSFVTQTTQAVGLPVMSTGISSTSSFAPSWSLPKPKVQTVTIKTFNGISDVMLPGAFIAKLERLMLSYHTDELTFLNECVPCWLEDDAADWFFASAPFSSWSDFKDRFLTHFQVDSVEHDLLAQVRGLQMQEGESFSKHLKKCTDILSNSGKKIDDQLQIRAILETLSSSYRSLALLKFNSMFDFRMRGLALESFEKNLKTRVGFKGNRDGFRPGFGRGKNFSPPYNPKYSCNQCNRKGWSRKYCRKCKSADSAVANFNQSVPNSVNENTSFDSKVFYNNGNKGRGSQHGNNFGSKAPNGSYSKWCKKCKNSTHSTNECKVSDSVKMPSKRNLQTAQVANDSDNDLSN